MRLFVSIFLIALITTGCSLDRLPFVYKMDIDQGNLVTQDMVDALRAGMTPSQVEFVMGSPMLVDPFHPARWDYITGTKPGGGEFRSERVTVFFENDRLVAVEGDITPQDPSLRRDS